MGVGPGPGPGLGWAWIGAGYGNPAVIAAATAAAADQDGGQAVARVPQEVRLRISFISSPFPSSVQFRLRRDPLLT